MTRDEILRQFFTTSDGKRLQINTGLNLKDNPERQDDYNAALRAYSSLYTKYIKPKSTDIPTTQDKKTFTPTTVQELVSGFNSPKAKEVVLNSSLDDETIKEISNRYGDKNPLSLLDTIIGTVRSQFPHASKYKIKVYYDDSDDNVSIISETKVNNSNIFVHRTFSIDENNNISVYHDMLDIDEKLQGKGTAKILLANSMKKYQQMGVSKVTTFASDVAGGYVWARFGFLPTQVSWDELRTKYKDIILRRLRQMNADDVIQEVVTVLLNMEDPKAIWSIADIPEWGKRCLIRTSWMGEFDLKNQENIERFNYYLYG